MKNLIFLFLAIVLITSCSQDVDPIETPIVVDFSGTYIGDFVCTNSQEGDYNENTTVIIEKIGDSDVEYTLFFEDEVTFTAVQNENKLILEKQIFNENEEFDVITMEASMEMIDNNLLLDSTISIDDEGESTCEATLIKQ